MRVHGGADLTGCRGTCMGGTHHTGSFKLISGLTGSMRGGAVGGCGLFATPENQFKVRNFCSEHIKLRAVPARTVSQTQQPKVGQSCNRGRRWWGCTGRRSWDHTTA